MNRAACNCIRFIVVALFLALMPTIARCAPQSLLVDSFDSGTVGALPTGWALAASVTGTWAKIEAGTPAGNKYARFHDDNAAGTISNNTLYRTFNPVTSGRVIAQFDVNPSQTTAGFGTRLWCGNPVTSGKSWASCILFEGNVAYASGGAPGRLSYQRNFTEYVPMPLARSYAANNWQTVRVETNLDSKMYKIFFGPKGGTLTEITPSGGIQFVGVTGGYTIDQIIGISFFSSNKNGDATGDLMIDNVNIYSDGAEPALQTATVAEARLLGRSTRVGLTNKIVTAGSAGAVFYIQDDDRTAGIRVRAFGTTVQQGDRVDVTGRISQSSEGTLSDHCGEREIIAEQVSVKSGGNLLPKPLCIRNMHIAGGWFGPMELGTDGYEPVIRGVWPYNSWGGSGVTVYMPNDDKLPPINNAGLLVTVLGKVTDSTVYDWYGTNWDFYVDDGSVTNDGWFGAMSFTDEAFHPKGLRVRITDPNILSEVQPLYYGDILKITGIAGAVACGDLGRASGRNIRVIRPRKPEDIQVVQRQQRYVKFDAQGNCIVDGKPFFPIGLFTYYWDSLTRPVILDQGFNTITSSIPGGVTPAHLSELQSDGIMVMPYMADVGAYDGWLAVKDHPTILAWYIMDEPEANGVTPRATPAQQRSEYERLREKDPTHPIGTAHYLWDALYNYRFSEDFTKSDIYPLHRAPITNVAVHIDRIHQIHGDGYPVWPYIQCFGGTEGFDVPSAAEERCMVYLALAHRSKGIFFFSYYPSLTETWAEVKRVVSEMKQLAPFYCLPSTEPALGNTNGNIHTRLIRIGNSGLIITVNVSGEAQTATFTIPGTAPDSLALPVEGGTVPVTGGSFTATFDPLAVHVYQWGPVPPADLFRL